MSEPQEKPITTAAEALRYCDSLADFCYQCKGPNHINDGSKCCPQCAANKLTELEEIATELRSSLVLLMMATGKAFHREPVIRAEASIEAFDVFMEDPCWQCGTKHKGRDCHCNCMRDTNDSCPVHSIRGGK